MSEVLPNGRPLQSNTAVQFSVVCSIPVLLLTVSGFIFWPKCTAASLMLSDDFPVPYKYVMNSFFDTLDTKILLFEAYHMQVTEHHQIQPK